MKIIPKQPNPSGAYPPIISWCEPTPPDTHYEVVCDISEYFNGFIIPTVTGGKVTGFVCNTNLWEAWKASEAAKPTPVTQPTTEEKLAELQTISAASSADFQAFMDYYFSVNPE